MSDSYLIGVDGGGTKTIAVAARADGTVIGAERGEGINYNNIGMDRARRNLKEIIDRLESRIDGHCEGLAVGMPALDMPADDALTRLFAGNSFDPALLDLQSDAYMALVGFTLGKAGMIVICGTGSILLMMDENGAQHVRGGWGHLLGDPGSGYALAVDGLKAAIADWENIGPHTSVTRAAEEYFRLLSPRQLIDRVYAEGQSRAELARFGRLVLEQCALGDGVALGIARKNMSVLAANAAEMIARVPAANRVGIYGGVLTNSAVAREIFTDQLKKLCPDAEVSLPEFPPELGALIHALNRRSLLSPETLRRMKASYREFL